MIGTCRFRARLENLEPNAIRCFVAWYLEAGEAERSEKHFSGQVHHETIQFYTVRLPKLFFSSFSRFCVFWGRVGVVLGSIDSLEVNIKNNNELGRTLLSGPAAESRTPAVDNDVCAGDSFGMNCT